MPWSLSPGTVWLSPEAMLIKEYGPDTVMGAGSARGPGNEVGYLTQKFMRAVIGTNNVDHCARI